MRAHRAVLRVAAHVAPEPRAPVRRRERRAAGLTPQLTAHRAAWSGEHPENSLAAVRECYAEGAERVEIDVLLLDGDFIVAHDPPRAGMRLLRLAELLAVVRTAAGGTLLEIDAKDLEPWPAAAARRLTRLVDPVRDRVVVTSPADWNLRRLLIADPSLPIGFDPQLHLDWTRGRDVLSPPRGAYGYLDAHPLARRRALPVTAYLRERLEELVGLVPGVRELHLRLAFFERLQRDGVHDAVGIVHRAGALANVWTLNARTPRWRERLVAAVAAGVDVVTTDTPRELAAALSSSGLRSRARGGRAGPA